MKVFFPVGVSGAVEIPIKELKGSASAAGVFIEDGNLRGLIQLLQGMRIPLIHHPEAARQIAVKALAFDRMSSIAQEVADYQRAEEMVGSGSLIEVCEFAARGRSGAARRLVDFTDIEDDAFAQLARHALEGHEGAIWFLAGVHLTSVWRKRRNVLEFLSRLHGVAFDLWLFRALKGADAAFKKAVLKEEDILSILSQSKRKLEAVRQAAKLKDQAEPGWDDKIVRNGCKILEAMFGFGEGYDSD